MSFPLWPVLFITSIFYINFTARIILAPLLPVIEAELGIGHGAAGSLFLFVQLGLTAGLLTSGFLSASLTYRRTIACSSAGVGLALLLLAQANSLAGIRLGLVAIGATAGLYLPAGVPAITDLVEEGRWGRAMAIHELAPTLAFMTAPFAAEVILEFLPWRGVMAVFGVAAIALAVAFAVWGRGGLHTPKPPALGSMLRMFATPEAWMMGLFFAVGVGISMGLFTIMTLFLVSEAGMPRTAANTLVGFSRLLAIPVVFCSGMLVDRLGARRALVVAQTITGSITLLLGLIQDPRLLPLLVLLQAGTAAFFFPAGFALLPTVFPPQLRSLAVSVAVTMGTLLGAGGVPSASGYLAEVVSFRLAFALIGLIALASPLLLRLQRRAPQP
jgi:NNP family nitrate/nitrite transporter-like MFS transporter